MGFQSSVLVSVLILHLLPFLVCGQNETIKDTEIISKDLSTMSVIKFTDLLNFQERHHEAEFLMEVFVNDYQGEEETIRKSVQGMFLNARSIEVLSVSLQHNTHVGIKVKVKVTIGCQMHYTLYPYDSHLCSITLMPPPVTEERYIKIIPQFCGDLKTYEFRMRGYLSIPLVSPAKMHSTNKNDEFNPIPRVIHIIIERTSGMQIFSQMYSPVLMLALLSFLTLLSTFSYPIRIASSLSMLLTILLVTSVLWREIPRAGKGDVTILEHFFAICVGFVLQAFITNILLYWYSTLIAKKASRRQTGDLEGTPSDEEANVRNGKTLSMETLAVDVVEHSLANMNSGITKKTKETKCAYDNEEDFIKSMGKCHRLMYFKSLKPAKKHLPVAFLVINMIYWIMVIYLSSRLPKGFQELTDADAATFCT